MDMNFSLVLIFILSTLYAIAITSWRPGYKLAQRLDWLAFALGELLVIGIVALMGSVTATELFLINASGAVPMVLRWAYLDIIAADRTELRKAYDAATEMADTGRESTN